MDNRIRALLEDMKAVLEKHEGGIERVGLNLVAFVQNPVEELEFNYDTLDSEYLGEILESLNG